jgi:Bardet-Biedl syndrome 1 protein
MFHMDGNEPQTPAIAVASGAYLYIYKNMKPFYKFTLPLLQVSTLESNAWTEVNCEKIDVQMLRESLNNVRLEVGDTNLSARTQTFLGLDDISQMETFVQNVKNEALKRQTVITCMATIKKTVSDENAVSCLVLGTENCDIFILEPDAFTILVSVSN